MVTMNLTSNEGTSQSVAILHELSKKLKFLEEVRKESFQNWQYEENVNCSVQKMAEAGFYYCGTSEEDDSATCFVCGKVLDGWEQDDEPWEEHSKHAPNCKFVKMHKSEDEMTVEQFFDLASMLLKSHATSKFNKKLVTVKKRIDEINTCLKNQQL